MESGSTKAPARARAVVLEGDDHAKHGRVAEDDVPNRGGEMEQKQLQIVKGRSAGPLVPSPAFSRLFGMDAVEILFNAHTLSGQLPVGQYT